MRPLQNLPETVLLSVAKNLNDLYFCYVKISSPKESFGHSVQKDKILCFAKVSK